MITTPKKSSGTSKAAKKPKTTFDWDLRLYVAGPTPKSIAALKNIRRICEEHLLDRYQIKVIDLMKNPQLAQGDQILAVPTLVRKMPVPIRRVIGNLSNTERVLISLELSAADVASFAAATKANDDSAR